MCLILPRSEKKFSEDHFVSGGEISLRLSAKYGIWLLVPGISFLSLYLIAHVSFWTEKMEILFLSLASIFLVPMLLLWTLALVFPWKWFNADRMRWALNLFTMVSFFFIFLGSLLGFYAPSEGFRYILLGLGCLVSMSLAIRGPALGLYLKSPKLSWELRYLAIIGLLALALYTFRLNNLPAGAHGHEGIMVPVISSLGKSSYTPYIEDTNVNWASVIFYQALLSSKIFGMSPAGLRVPSAIWGLLAVLTFYFLMRRLASPAIACISTALFAVDPFMLNWSRNLFPGTILMFSELTAFYFLLTRRNKNDFRNMFLAGLAVGLALHGYIPGRAFVPCVVIWAALVTILPGEKKFVARDWMALLAGIFVIAMPILIWYIGTGGQHYWEYIGMVNPSQNDHLQSYLSTFFQNLTPYLKMFNLEGDPDGATPNVPWLGPFVGAIFLFGIWLCLIDSRRKEYLLLLLSFGFGVLPAIMGAGFTHPTSRRAIMAFPLCYVFFGMGLQGSYRLLIHRHIFRELRVGLILIGSLLMVVQGFHSLKAYFYDYAHNPMSLLHLDHTGFLIREDLAQLPQPAKVYLPISFKNIVTPMTFAGVEVGDFPEPEDIFRIKPRGNCLIALEGIYSSAVEFIQAALPNARVRRQANVYAGAVPDAELDTYVSQALFWSVALDRVAFGPIGHFLLSSKGESDKLVEYGQSLPRLNQTGRFSISGSLIAPPQGRFVTFHKAMSSGSLWINGVQVPWDKACLLSGEVNDLVVRGTIENKKFSFPFHIDVESSDDLCFLPMRWPHGISMMVTDDQAPGHSILYRHPYSAYRFGAYNWKDSWKVEADTVVQIPESGTYQFGAVNKCGLHIWAGNEEIFNNWSGQERISKAIFGSKGQRIRLKILYNGLQDMGSSRAFQLLWKRPKDHQFVSIPATTLWFP